jgi:hypothetical protein
MPEEAPVTSTTRVALEFEFEFEFEVIEHAMKA